MEYFWDVMASFGWSFKEGESVLLREFPAFFDVHCLVWLVALVCYQYFRNIWCGVLINLSKPVLYVVEGDSVWAVVDEDDAHGALVVGLRDRAEPLLPRRVPNLQLHVLPIDVYRLYLKVYAYKDKDDIINIV